MNAFKLIQLRTLCLVLTSLLLMISVQTKCLAAGTLVITPTRIIFDERTRSAKVTLLNTGTEAASYRATFVRREMKQDGGFLDVEAGVKGNYSDEMIRYSPRQVTLPPGQSQVVRLMLRKPRDLAAGEYRSHMLFQALPEPKSNDIDQAESDNPDAIVIEITPLIGITIPIIVRHGNLKATVTLTDPQFIPANKDKIKPSLKLNILRDGNRSVYGDFKVTYTAEGQQSGLVVAQAKGVGVYTSITSREFELVLESPPGINFDKGLFTISYSEQNEKSRKASVSTVELTIP